MLRGAALLLGLRRKAIWDIIVAERNEYKDRTLCETILDDGNHSCSPF
jgi:hypothetical protein